METEKEQNAGKANTETAWMDEGQPDLVTFLWVTVSSGPLVPSPPGASKNDLANMVQDLDEGRKRKAGELASGELQS